MRMGRLRNLSAIHVVDDPHEATRLRLTCHGEKREQCTGPHFQTVQRFRVVRAMHATTADGVSRRSDTSCSLVRAYLPILLADDSAVPRRQMIS